MHIPEDLLQAARLGDLNVLAGAGVSIDAGLPGWDKLLREFGVCLADQSKLAPIERLIAQGRMLDAAELLRSEISPSRICDRLKHLLRRKPTETPVADGIWLMKPKFVLTTNFDSILESSLARVLSVAGTVLIPGVNAPPLMFETEHVVAKLHGDLSAPESIILSRSDYFRTMLSAQGFGGIWAEFLRRPTIALGYSLRDPDLQLFLHWSEERMRGLARSLFLVIPAIPEEDRRLLDLLPGVVVMEYDACGGHRRPLLELLSQLQSQREQAEKQVPSALEIRGILLERYNRHIAAFLHDAHSPIALAQVLAQELRDAPAESNVQKTLARLADSLSKGMKNLDALGSLLADGSKHPSQCGWVEARNSLEADLEHLIYANVDCDLAPDSDFRLPISSSLYSVLVRVLVDNAIEASTKSIDKSIQVTAKIQRVASGSILNTEVRDHGPGIAREVVSTVFDQNVSTKGEARGMGLHLLRCLAEESGGGARITSSTAKGTSAAFWIPLAPPPLTAPSARNEKRKKNSRKARNEIIYIEDNVDFADDLAEFFLEAGEPLRRFYDGQSALEYLTQSTVKPDCIISDLGLPDMDGFQLLLSVRQHWPSVAIIITTGRVAFDNRLLAESMFGANCKYFGKPFQPNDLLVATRDVIKQAKET